MAEIYLDEKYIGDVDSPKEFVKKIRSERRKGNFPNSMNVYYNMDYNEIIMDSGKGRARRPLIIVANGKSLLTEKHIDKLGKEFTWDDLVKEGVIEYLDASEEENALVALSENELTTKHTHLEISPVTILGMCTSLVPYANFNASSKLIIGNKFQKQALGLYASNFLIRMDTDVSVLHYPQVPIVKSFTSDIYPYEEYPNGQNIVIALMSYEGYNVTIIKRSGNIWHTLLLCKILRNLKP
jgi:DNA-directed RNA polymerase subunit B'